MSLQTMYEGVVNSPATTITNDINSTDTTIYLLDPTNVPAELPNLMVLGTGANAETVKVLSIDGSSIEVERGFQGTARSWNSGTVIARNFTEYDYNALVENVTELDTSVGDLDILETEEKENLVAAVNEIDNKVNTHEADNASAHGIDTKANKTPPTWINLTLQNGWDISSLPRYRKNEFGELQLQGRITSGTTTGGTILFTLPEGYRVIGSRTIITSTYTTSSTKILLLTFTSNGEVSIHNGNTADMYITLENITISL